MMKNLIVLSYYFTVISGDYSGNLARKANIFCKQATEIKTKMQFEQFLAIKLVASKNNKAMLCYLEKCRSNQLRNIKELISKKNI